MNSVFKFFVKKEKKSQKCCHTKNDLHIKAKKKKPTTKKAVYWHAVMCFFTFLRGRVWLLNKSRPNVETYTLIAQ